MNEERGSTGSYRASLILAAHNEGDRLWKTVASCKETLGRLRCEIIVSDDASTDGCVEEAAERFPDLRVVRSASRLGPSPTKDRGGRRARGEVLVFLDGHCKPEPRAIERLVNDVEDSEGRSLFVPRLPALDCESWENLKTQVGQAYRMDLESFECSWPSLEDLRPEGRFYQSPALIGCCVAISRRLYERLRGFDPDMREYAVEDLDLGLKAWLMGHAILLDARATVGHRFREHFDNFSFSDEAVVANHLRMARKNFSDESWEEWVARLRPRLEEGFFDAAWSYFERSRESAEEERAYLLENRIRDEFWYADHFGFSWPVRRSRPGRASG